MTRSSLKSAIASPLNALGFSHLQSLLLCLGLSLIFFNQVVAPRIDELQSLQNQQQDFQLRITEQKLIQQQLAESNRALTEDEFHRFVKYRKLTLFRTNNEFTLDEYLRSQSPRM